MAITRNTKNVPYYQLGFGAFAQLGELVDARRGWDGSDGPALFYVDHYFQDKPLLKQLPARSGDKVIVIDTLGEPTVEYVDALADGAKAMLGGRLPCCMVGVGGGSVLDIAKAVANLLTNPGKAEDYQGWELVKQLAVYKVGVPTLSGTGAECSRTCVMMNEKRKLRLGMNSDFTVYDQLLLDPELCRSAPRDQFFFTGIDTYMHCFESIRGSYRNVIVDKLSLAAMPPRQDATITFSRLSSDIIPENPRHTSWYSSIAASDSLSTIMLLQLLRMDLMQCSYFSSSV